VDPFTALAALRAAYSGIQYCCDCLNEGTAAVQKVKKAAEQAQQIAKDVKGIWGIIRSLFGSKPAPATTTPTPASEPAKPGKKPKEEYTTHIPTEDEMVTQFVQHVGNFFSQHRALSEYCEKRYAEVYAMDRPDPRDILELSQIKNELDGAYMKLSEMMRVRAPKQLGPLWDNFNQIYGQVQEEQQARKERERIKRQNDAWLQDQTKIFLIDRLVALVVVAGLTAWAWALMWSSGWQDLTPLGFVSS
jgi:hypothetical protein